MLLRVLPPSGYRPVDGKQPIVRSGIINLSLGVSKTVGQLRCRQKVFVSLPRVSVSACLVSLRHLLLSKHRLTPA